MIEDVPGQPAEQNPEGAVPVETSSSADPSPADGGWSGLDDAARRRLIDETRAAIGHARHDLAEGFARATGRAGDLAAVSEGYLLGAAAAASYTRALAGNLGRTVALMKRGGRTYARRSLAERLAQQGLAVRVLAGSNERKNRNQGTSEGRSIVYSDADAPAILLNLVVREGFVEGRRPHAIAPSHLAGPMATALQPLVRAGLVSIEPGGMEEVCAAIGRSTDAVVAVASGAAREAFRAATKAGHDILGFASSAPSPIAIVPFLYGREELETLARHVVAELTAPSGPTRGVALVVARDWLQRKVFLDMLRATLAKRKHPTSSSTDDARIDDLRGPSDRETSANTWLVLDQGGRGGERSPDVSGLRIVTVFDSVAGEPEGFLDESARTLAELGKTQPLHLVSLFAHPMLLERAAFVTRLEDWASRVDVPVIGIGARASVAWALGGPPVGPRGGTIQNAWGLDETTRVVVEGSLRARVPSTRAELDRRARFEAQPKLGSALLLGARSFF